jgi:hypothetical protein
MFRLGIAALLFIALLAIAVGVTAVSGSALDRQSKDAIDKIIPIICRSWDVAVIKKYESPELAKSVTDEKLNQFFGWFSEKLGPLKNYVGSKGDSNVYFDLGHMRRHITAHYQCEVELEKGKANIEISLIRLDNQWLITKFDVRSDALIALPKQ